MGKEKVLIFGTHQGNVDILSGILKEFDFQISTTGDKDHFFELLKEKRFDLIFYDIEDDAQFSAKNLKKIINSEINSEVLVVIIEDGAGNSAKHLEKNVIATIQKPFNIDVIKCVTRSFVRLKEIKETSMKNFYDSLAAFVHDLKTPLVARDYASKILLEDTSSLNETQKEILNELHLSTKYLLALTNNFLAKYKYENLKIILSKSLRDIVLDLHEVLFEIKYYAKSKSSNISLNVPDECFVQYDEIGIKRIFYNLLINAIKYSPKNSEIKITLVEKSAKVRLIVDNYTEEIEKSKFKNIFKKFASYHNSGSKAGCGIGLTICKKIAKMHGGDIKAKIEKLQNDKSNKLNKVIFEMTLPSAKNRKR